MGIKILLPIVIGVVMLTLSLSKVTPSLIEGNKILKVENKLINNQSIIFESIKRYIIVNQKLPNDIEELVNNDFLLEKHIDNGFGGTFSFTINKLKGVVDIRTIINDEYAADLFIKSFKNKFAPKKIGNELSTLYIIPTNLLHGNGQLNSQIHVGSTPPLNENDKYWYDTSSGKATLKMTDGSRDSNGELIWKKLFTGIDKSKIDENKIYDNFLDLSNNNKPVEIGEISHAYDEATNSIQEYVYLGEEEGWVGKGYSNTTCKANYGYGECPNGFIEIPNSHCVGAFKQEDVNKGVVEQIKPPKGWCVMKYEPTIASGIAPTISYNSMNWQDHYDYNENIKVVSKANTQPINFVSNQNAKAICSRHLVNYDGEMLQGGIPMTYNISKLLSQDLLNNNINWSGGNKGSGYIYRGHVDNAPASAILSSTNDNLGYSGTGQSTGDQKRTLTTSKNEIIWDYSGNLWEILYEGQNSSSSTTNYREYININSSHPFNPNNILNTIGLTWTNVNNGISGSWFDNGSFNINNITSDIIVGNSWLIRGTGFDTGSSGGILGVYLNTNVLTHRNYNVTTRCVIPRR